MTVFKPNMYCQNTVNEKSIQHYVINTIKLLKIPPGPKLKILMDGWKNGVQSIIPYEKLSSVWDNK